jgi:hypothetical protein
MVRSLPDNPRIHHPEPGWWYERQKDHHGVSGRQLRRMIIVSQDLIGAGYVRMMVRMAGQFEQYRTR